VADSTTSPSGTGRRFHRKQYNQDCTVKFED
jgi:hypothetical protein